MADDIVTRLRWLLDDPTEDAVHDEIAEAADEIERLRGELNSLANAQDGWGRVPKLEAEIERWKEVAHRISWAWSVDTGAPEGFAVRDVQRTYEEVCND